jgi:hypothetical protein
LLLVNLGSIVQFWFVVVVVVVVVAAAVAEKRGAQDN